MARKAAAQAVKEGAPPEIKEMPPPLIGEVEVDVSDDEGLATQPVEIETRVPEPEPEPPPPQPDDSALQQRLRESEAAERAAREAARQAQEALARAQREQETSRWQSQKQIWDAQYDAVVNSLGAEQAKLAAAKNELRTVGAEGNWELISELQEQIGRSASDIRELERRKDWMDSEAARIQQQVQQQPRQQQQPQQQQQPRQPTQQDGLAQIDAWNGPDRAKKWLREHVDYVLDPAKNAELQSYHKAAARLGGGEFTDGYYDQMETMLGLKQPNQQSNGNGQQRQPATRQSALVSAPPTREAPSMTTGRAPQPTKVTLSAEEREVASSIAASRNISQQEAEKIYAKEKIRMMRDKANGQG